MPFSEVFGGSTIYPSQQSYLALALSANVSLSWPIEQQVGGNVVADIIDLTASAPGLNVDLPDARQVSTGYTALFNNVGAQTVTVRNAQGATLISLTSGTTWQLYLTDNSTIGGTWRVFQYGATVSVANAAALAGSGLKAISTTLNQTMPASTSSTTPLTLVDADRAKAIVWTGGIGAWTLTAPATVGNDWFINIRNGGSGNLTLTPASGLINASANLVLGAGQSATIFTDGSNYYTISGASSSSGSFDYVTIDVSGAGDYTLAGVNLNRVAYRFTGLLTGTRNIIVPNSIQQYWVSNGTTGAFSLYVKTSLQSPGIQVPQGDQNIMYCDGTNVIDAESSTVSFPIPIAQGGTGAITAGAALTNLGAIATTRLVSTGAGLTGGGDLSADRTLSLDTGSSRNTDHAAVTVTGGSGVTGGGDLTASRVLSLDTGSSRNTDHATVTITGSAGVTGGGDITASRSLSLDTGSTRNTDHAAVSVTAGAGLTGGGTIDATRTLDVGAGTGITVAADSVGLDTANSRNVDHTAVSISTSTGLSGGGDLTATRTLQVDRTGTDGNQVGYLDLLQNVQAGNYTLVITDRGKQIYYAGAGGHTYTIPANGSVAFPAGTAIDIVNNSSSNLAIAITTDTLRWFPGTTTGNRTLAPRSTCCIKKITSTEWIVLGVGLT